MEAAHQRLTTARTFTSRISTRWRIFWRFDASCGDERSERGSSFILLLLCSLVGIMTMYSYSISIRTRAKRSLLMRRRSLMLHPRRRRTSPTPSAVSPKVTPARRRRNDCRLVPVPVRSSSLVMMKTWKRSRLRDRKSEDRHRWMEARSRLLRNRRGRRGDVLHLTMRRRTMMTMRALTMRRCRSGLAGLMAAMLQQVHEGREGRLRTKRCHTTSVGPMCLRVKRRSDLSTLYPVVTPSLH